MGSNIYNMICENCSNTHDGSYGSGRFCNQTCRNTYISKKSRTPDVIEKIRNKLTKNLTEVKLICCFCQKEFSFSRKEGSSYVRKCCSIPCARSFSTQASRKEINEKISKKLKGINCKTGLPSASYIDHKKVCVGCGVEFITKRKNQKYHNKQCACRFTNSNPDVQEKIRLARYKAMDNDASGGMGIRSYCDGIRCDSALEYAFIKWYKQKNPEADIKRFRGFLEGCGIKYQPDFIINNKIIVEVKHSSHNVGKTYLKKWSTYQTTQEAKLALLQPYEHLWITEKDIGKKFYYQCINEIKSKIESMKD